MKLSVLDLLPSKYKTFVTCRACGKRSQIAGSTRIGAGVAGMMGAAIAVALTLRTSVKLCVVVSTLASLVAGHLAARLMLRLDPTELAD